MKACIDHVSRSKISGWGFSEDDNPISLFIDNKHIQDLTNFYKRQDVIDAGITSQDCGFTIDLQDHLEGKTGIVRFQIKEEDVILAEQELLLKDTRNVITNPFFILETINRIGNWEVNSNHRIGLLISSFASPQGLTHTNGHYTRISFRDTHNSRSKFELEPELALSEPHLNCMQFGIVARASQVTNLHVKVISKVDEKAIFDEPITLSTQWEYNLVDLDVDTVEQINRGEAILKLTTKHYGKRHIDLSMACLAEDAENMTTGTIASNEPNYTLTHEQANLLFNGDLSRWSNGINYRHLTRGQELADNWFIEFNRSNLGKIAIAAISDTSQNDPLKETLDSKFGLRVRTKELDGYARLIIPFPKDLFDCINYELKLDIEASTLNKKSVLPKIYVIARDSRKDLIVSDIIRKQSITGREQLSFNISALQVEQIITQSVDFPTLCIAIDMAESSDTCIYSINLAAAPERTLETKVNSDSRPITTLQFEDTSIIEQLNLLKGINSWSSSEAVIPQAKIHNARHHIESTLSARNEFLPIVASLNPHKLNRPSRNFPFIDIIVPVYNACDDVLLCLSALIEKTDLLHRVIIINDGEDERTAKMLEAFDSSYNHLEVVNNPENIGYTRSVNKGINHSNADWVVVLNSDTIVSEGWLGRLINCAVSEDRIGMVGALSNAASWQSVPHIHDDNGEWHLNPLPEGISVDQMAQYVSELSNRDYPQVEVINGFCQLINMDMLDEIGLLDDIAFPVGYGEENDMCARAVKAGYKLLIADDTYVFHAKSKSFGHEKRKVLAKQGSAALKKKHPDVDWGRITKDFFENESLVSLREQLSQRLFGK
jgi:GT2 family glycosyltransferase